jgi:hypothetical protein
MIWEDHGVDDFKATLLSTANEFTWTRDRGYRHKSSPRLQLSAFDRLGPTGRSNGCTARKTATGESERFEPGGEIGCGITFSGAGQEDCVRSGASSQRFAESTRGKQAPATIAVGRWKCQEIEVPKQAEMRKAIVEQKDLGCWLDSSQGVLPGLVPVSPHNHRNSG